MSTQTTTDAHATINRHNTTDMSSHSNQPTDPINASQRALIDRLIKIAGDSGAIDEAKTDEIAKRSPISAMEILNDAHFYQKNHELKAAINEREHEVLAILALNKRTAHQVTDLVFQLEHHVRQNDTALRDAKMKLHEIDPKKLEPTMRRRGEIRECDVSRLASRIFAQLARQVLNFSPKLAHESDPSTGPKLWMYSVDRQLLEECGLSVKYKWHEEAKLVVQDWLCDSSESKLRAALQFLTSIFRDGKAWFAPLATVDGSSMQVGGCLSLPPEQGPYTLRPPADIDDFLKVILIGMGSEDYANEPPF
jgi:hypothetical protein